MENDVTMPSMSDLGLDLDTLKEVVASQETTNVNERISDDVIVATKFDNENLENVSQSTKQVFLIDLLDCDTVTEAWIKGLHNIILCTELSQFNYEESNKGRFEKGLTELLPDTTLTLRFKSGAESKILFIGYSDSCQTYEFLSSYVQSIKGAKLYREKDGKLQSVKVTDIHGLRVHV